MPNPLVPQGRAPDVYVAMPTYNSTCDTGAATGWMMASRKFRCAPGTTFNSLLPSAFNKLWIGGVLSGAKYWAMIHADITPEPFWFDLLHEEMEYHNADVMSAIVPIKDTTNDFSVCLSHPGKPAHYRLTIEDYLRLPPTFDQETLRDVTGRQGLMGVNTGLWICRLRQPWNKQVHFQMHSWIDWTTDPPKAEAIPEDWDFSHQCHKLGLKVMATKAVPLLHVGQHAWAADGEREERSIVAAKTLPK